MRIVEEKDFANEIKEGVVLVDFFATWCGPCRIMGQILEDIAGEVEGKVKVFKVDVDQSGEVARSFGIMSIPTLIIFKDGKEQEKHVGIWQYEDYVLPAPVRYLVLFFME